MSDRGQRSPRFGLPRPAGQSNIGTLLRLMAGAVLVTALAMLVSATGPMRALDHGISDLRFSIAPRAPTGAVALVDIDARSLQSVGVWPWPRTIHAQLLDRLQKLGAAQIAFDIDFSSTSTASGDEDLRAALDRASVPVFLASFAQRTAETSDAVTLEQPIAPFLENTWPVLVNVPVDGDGYVRHFPARLAINGQAVESMPAVLASAISPPSVIGIDYSIDANALPRFSYVDVVDDKVPEGALAGKTVIVGATAAELHDLVHVPRFGIVAGPTVVALATDTLLQGRSLKALDWPVLGLVAACLAALALRFAAGRRLVASLMGVSVACEAAALVLQVGFGIVAPTLAAHLVVVAFGAWAMVRELDLRSLSLLLARSEASNTRRMLERVVDDGFGGVIIIDDQDKVSRINSAAAQMLRRPRLKPGTPISALPPEMRNAALTARAIASRDPAEHASIEQFAMEHAPGDHRHIEFSAVAFEIEASPRKKYASGVRQYVCLACRDVTERHRAQEDIRHIAYHDALTGLPNRRALINRLEDIRSDASGLPVGVLFFDLDRFKTINDGLGHGVGDALIVAAARRAGEALGPAFLARLGGDEFAAIVPANDAEAAGKAAARVVDAFSQPFEVSGHRLTLGASSGSACWAGRSVTPGDIMRHADLALHAAKNAGGRCARHFEPDMEEHHLLRLQLEQDLSRALDRNEIELVYQPQIALKTREIVGVEALMRWRHPTRGYVSPAQFIPIAEETGYIHRLTHWLAHTACSDAAGWIRPIKLAINISPVDIQGNDLLALVTDALAATGLPADRLELEITESAFLSGGDAMDDLFRSVRELGATFALDDFGTGYSSLGYLHRFQFSKLKIDRSFVTGIPRDGSSMAILRSIFTLSQGMGLKTIAEGIETVEQAEILELLGCELGQGYLFSKPITHAALRSALERPEPFDIDATVGPTRRPA